MGDKRFWTFNFIAFELTGVFIAIVRIQEPFVWQEFKIWFNKYCCCSRK